MAILNNIPESHKVEAIDIHKIIDDAMEKKDRRVTVFMSSAGTSVYVDPYDDKPLEWIVTCGNGNPFVSPYKCPSCGIPSEVPDPYCRVCGEKLKMP